MRVLLFEDHGRLADSIIRGLAGLGLGVDAFQTAADGLSAFKSIAYDAIVLDLGLPDLDGLEVLKDLRQRNLSVPILILTARDSIDSRVSGLDSGADDYLVKPFVMKELAARLRALLRRPGRALGDVLTVANLQIQTSLRQVTVDHRPVRFPIREIEALELLTRREGQVVPKDRLEDALYGLNKNVTPNSIEVLISRLRRRLASSGADCTIHTLYGIGYLLRENVH
jgi:DNA-binding response OmpR family regulator